MKNIKEKIKNLNLDQLKEIKSLIDKEYKKKKKKKRDENIVDEFTNEEGIYFRLEQVFCNKDSCTKCNIQEMGHGPYWYAYIHGKRKYIGKKNKSELNNIQLKKKRMKLNVDNSLPFKK